MLEQPVGTVLDQIKGSEVARRAAKTTGAFYHHWATQTEYQHELIEHVLGPDRLASGEMAAGLHAALQADVSLPQLVYLVGHATFVEVRDNPLLPLFFSLWAKQSQNEQIRGLLHRNYQAASAISAAGYQIVLDHYGLRMREPYTLDMFTVILTGLIQGLAVRAAVDPDAVAMNLSAPSITTSEATSPAGTQWDLFNATALTLVDAMTTPRSD